MRAFEEQMFRGLDGLLLAPVALVCQNRLVSFERFVLLIKESPHCGGGRLLCARGKIGVVADGLYGV